MSGEGKVHAILYPKDQAQPLNFPKCGEFQVKESISTYDMIPFFPAMWRSSLGNLVPASLEFCQSELNSCFAHVHVLSSFSSPWSHFEAPIDLFGSSGVNRAKLAVLFLEPI